jgi:hypothetical protein
MAKSFKDAARARAAAQAQLDSVQAGKRAAALQRPDGAGERYQQKARTGARVRANAFDRLAGRRTAD